jgi:hypothetical protein
MLRCSSRHRVNAYGPFPITPIREGFVLPACLTGIVRPSTFVADQQAPEIAAHSNSEREDPIFLNLELCGVQLNSQSMPILGFALLLSCHMRSDGLGLIKAHQFSDQGWASSNNYPRSEATSPRNFPFCSSARNRPRRFRRGSVLATGSKASRIVACSCAYFKLGIASLWSWESHLRGPGCLEEGHKWTAAVTAGCIQYQSGSWVTVSVPNSRLESSQERNRAAIINASP